MSWEVDKEYLESEPQYKPDPPEPFSLWKKTRWYIVVGVVCFIFGFSCNACHSNEVVQKNRELVQTNQKLKKELENASSEKANVKVPVSATESIKPSKEAAPVTQASAANEDSSYEHNEFYDLVESSTFKDSIGYNTVVHKVLAKQDVSVSATLLAYGTDGNVIGKSSDDIILTKGEYNFFRYSIENDISSATIHLKAQAEEDSFMVGARKAVEMVQYNQNGKDLYITFKQNVDKLGTFAKFKLLFYKDDKIVDTEDGYFNIYAKNMIGKGDTDVAEIWVYGTDYDRFEYIYEP